MINNPDLLTVTFVDEQNERLYRFVPTNSLNTMPRLYWAAVGPGLKVVASGQLQVGKRFKVPLFTGYIQEFNATGLKIKYDNEIFQLEWCDITAALATITTQIFSEEN